MMFKPDLVIIGFCLNDIAYDMATIKKDEKNNTIWLYSIKNNAGEED